MLRSGGQRRTHGTRRTCPRPDRSSWGGCGPQPSKLALRQHLGL